MDAVINKRPYVVALRSIVGRQTSFAFDKEFHPTCGAESESPSLILFISLYTADNETLNRVGDELGVPFLSSLFVSLSAERLEAIEWHMFQ